MEKELTLFGQNVQRSHFFFDDENEQSKCNPQENKVNKKTKDLISSSISNNLSNEIVRNITKSYKIFNDTITRSKNLDKVSKHLELQKNLKSKGKRKKIVNKNGNTEFVWYPKRKK